MSEVLQAPEVIEALVAATVAVLAVIAGLAGLAVAQVKKVKELTESTNTQVTNNHQSNLRDDVTEVRDLVQAGFRRMDHQFGEIHDQVQREARDRQALDDRAQEEHRRIWKAIEKN